MTEEESNHYFEVAKEIIDKYFEEKKLLKECRQTGRTNATTEKVLKTVFSQMKETDTSKVLKETEKNKTPCEKAFKRVYGYCPEVCERSVWVAFIKGYKSAQEDYKVGEFQPTPQEPKPMDDAIDRLLEKYKSQKLWNMMRNELGYSIDCCDEIVDLVERWLPKEQSAEGSQNVDVELLVDGFNDAIQKMKEMLR